MTEHILVEDGQENVLTAIEQMKRRPVDMILCTGGMSVDPDDSTPGAIKASGADIVTYGAPVLPGAMFLLGYYGDGRPVIGTARLRNVRAKQRSSIWSCRALQRMCGLKSAISSRSARADCVSAAKAVPIRTAASGGECGGHSKVITVSDRSYRGEREDAGGPAVKALLERAGYTVGDRAQCPMSAGASKKELIRAADEENIALIVTTGGTGFAERDVTPEATIAVCGRLAPGIPEAMRAASMRITPKACLSRAAAGIRGRV